MPLSRSDRRRLDTVARRLSLWFSRSGRGFPWRGEGVSVYHHVCVEVLVQRTKAETVAAFYPAFFDRFRSWGDIANTEIVELEDFLKPVGLWKRRAISFAKLADYAVAHDGRFPKTNEELLKIPAVGQYVANSIQLFAHGERAPLLDMNMARVLERYLRPRDLADIRYDPWLQAAAWYLVGRGDARIINWAILDLGGLVCTPRKPKCSSCPLSRGCKKFGVDMPS